MKLAENKTKRIADSGRGALWLLGLTALCSCAPVDGPPKKGALQVARETAIAGFIDGCLSPDRTRKEFEQALDQYSIGYSSPTKRSYSTGYPLGTFSVSTDGSVMIARSGPQRWSCEILERGNFASQAIQAIQPRLAERSFSVVQQETLTDDDGSWARVFQLSSSDRRFDLVISQTPGTNSGSFRRGAGTAMRIIARPTANDRTGKTMHRFSYPAVVTLILTLAGCAATTGSSDGLSRDQAVTEVTALFDSVCIQNLGRIQQSRDALAASGLTRASSTGNVDFYADHPRGLYALYSSVNITQESGGNVISRSTKRICAVGATSLSPALADEIRETLRVKYLAGRGTYTQAAGFGPITLARSFFNREVQIVVTWGVRSASEVDATAFATPSDVPFSGTPRFTSLQIIETE